MAREKIKTGMVENTSFGSRIADGVIIALLALFMFICFIPMWHVLMASFSDGRALLAHEGLLLWPVGEPNIDAYKLTFADPGILKGYANTLINVTGATLIGMSINILGGYVLSRPSRFRGLLTVIIMFTVLFSGGLVPTYMVIRQLGMVGTRWSLLIPGCTNAMFVVMMSNAFRSVPESTVEAAQIDGAGHIRTMLRIMLPQAGGLSTVVMLNGIVMQWNSWFQASIYVPNNRDLWPLQLWIRQLMADNEGFLLNSNPDYARYVIQFAVIIIATIPILCAFPFFQKRLEKGTITGGVKG